jgi:hypothetical protein
MTRSTPLVSSAFSFSIVLLKSRFPDEGRGPGETHRPLGMNLGPAFAGKAALGAGALCKPNAP